MTFSDYWKESDDIALLFRGEDFEIDEALQEKFFLIPKTDKDAFKQTQRPEFHKLIDDNTNNNGFIVTRLRWRCSRLKTQPAGNLVSVVVHLLSATGDKSGALRRFGLQRIDREITRSRSRWKITDNDKVVVMGDFNIDLKTEVPTVWKPEGQGERRRRRRKFCL